jgi:hypothetical protein
MANNNAQSFIFWQFGMRGTERKLNVQRSILFVSNRRLCMQQLIITLMAVLGMMVPVLQRNLKCLLAAPHARRQSAHLLVILAQSGPVALRGTGGRGHVPRALYWRERDVDKPRRQA